MTDNNTPDSTEEVVPTGTSDNTEQPEGTEDVDLQEVGKSFVESKRKNKLAEKESKKYDSFVDEDGNVDYNGIKEIYRGNNISDKALELFCDENGLDLKETKSNLVSESDRRIQELETEMARLRTKVDTNKTKTFTDILKDELSIRNVSQKEFMKYKDSFEEELSDLEGLGEEKAIGKALNYALGNKSKAKIVRSDGSSNTTSSNILTQDQYSSFLSRRSLEVGNDQAVKEMEDYVAQRRSKGEPLFA